MCAGGKNIMTSIVAATIVSTIALALSGALATPALAQTDPTAPATDGKGEEVVVTATRSSDPIPRDLLGASATVLDDAALQERQTRIVSDILRDVPGVAVSRSGAIGGLTEVRIRGAEANQTLVLIDGIEAADPYYGEYDFGTLIADEDARVEVLRGQQSALYGSDAIGGVINYQTLTGAEAPGIRLRAEGGSQGTASAGARVAGVADTIDYAASTSFYHTDGYPTAIGGRRDIGSDSLGATAKATWTPSSAFKLTGVFRYSRTAADTNDTDANFGTPTYGLTVDSPGVRFVNDGYYGLLRGELSLFDGRFTNVVSGQIADTTRTGYDVADPNAAPAGQPIVAAYGDHGQRLKGSYAGTFHVDGDAVKQSLTAAVDVERERARTTISQYGAFLGTNQTTNTGLVGEYELTASDRLGFGASIRHDFNTRFADDTTFRAQASYLLPGGTRFHAAGGSGVKNPTLSQLFDYYAGRFVGDPNLKPTVSIGWEAGIGQRLAGGRVTLDATYFDNRLRNEITTVYDASFVGHPVNLPGSRAQRGVELSAAARLGDGWRLDASYTYLDAPQDRQVTFPGTLTTGTFTGQAVRRAQNIASGNISWAPERLPVSATVTVRYNGPQGDLFYGYFPPLLVDLHSFALVNLNATYKLGRQFELFGRVENLLDHRYVEIYGIATQPRAAYAGVKVRL
jgi:vitamin B12 transporter